MSEEKKIETTFDKGASLPGNSLHLTDIDSSLGFSSAVAHAHPTSMSSSTLAATDPSKKPDRTIFKQSITGDTKNVTVRQLDVSDCAIPDLCLMEDVLSPKMCAELVRFVEEQMAAGRAGKLKGRTYTPIPPNFKWKKQSRELLQYGVYTHSNRIEPAVTVASLPGILLKLIEHLRRAGVFTDPRTSLEVSSPSQMGNCVT